MAEKNNIQLELGLATAKGDNDQVESLLAKGADPNDEFFWSDQWVKPPTPGYSFQVVCHRPPVLHLACNANNLKIVKLLVEKGGADVNKIFSFDCDDVYHKNMTPLHFACQEGHMDTVLYLMEEALCDTSLTTGNNQTPLHVACREGKQDVAVYLIEKANCNTSDLKDDDSQTPLDLALISLHHYRGNTNSLMNIVLYLMDKGVGCVNQKASLFFIACREGRMDVVKKLVDEFKFDPTVPSDLSRGQSALSAAIQRKHVHISLYLIQHGLGNDGDFQRAFCKACELGTLNVVKEILKLCNINPTEKIVVEDLSPLGWSIKGKQRDIETYLRGQGFTLENDTNVLLSDACGTLGRLDIVKELIEDYKCDMLGVCDKWDNLSPLGVAARCGYLKAECREIADYLRSLGCEFYDDGSESKLCAAAKAGDLDSVKKTVEKIVESGREDILRLSWKQESPYQIAIENGHLDVAWYILTRYGQNVCESQELERAVFQMGNLHVLNEMIEYHYIDLGDADDYRPDYEVAINNGHFELALHMISWEFGVDSDKEKLFNVACANGRMDVLEKLVMEFQFIPKGEFLTGGALTDAVDLAIKNGNTEFAEYLRGLIPSDAMSVTSGDNGMQSLQA